MIEVRKSIVVCVCLKEYRAVACKGPPTLDPLPRLPTALVSCSSLPPTRGG